VITESERQTILDSEHLKLLPVFYWVLGAVDIFISLYGLFYVGMGALFAFAPFESGSSSSAPPAFIGWFFFAIGLAFMAGFGTMGGLKIAAGFWIRRRRHHTFGTIVGVLTFLVLLRPSVSALFEAGASQQPAAAPDDAPAAG
jgi:phosphoglycerol transferase MdoB-like AlkP superfamily enzyme